MISMARIELPVAEVLAHSGAPPGGNIDLAYAVHGRLARIFGNAAPRPWGMDVVNGTVYVRGYVDGGADPVEIPVAGECVSCSILATPTARVGQVERDVYLLRGLGRPREHVYVEWLGDQVERRGGGQLLSAAVVDHYLTDVVRLTNGDRRRAKIRRLPVARFQAVIEVGQEFESFLRRGVGRHRAFGAGLVEVAHAA